MFCNTSEIGFCSQEDFTFPFLQNKLICFIRPPDIVVGGLRFYRDYSSIFCLSFLR